MTDYDEEYRDVLRSYGLRYIRMLYRRDSDFHNEDTRKLEMKLYSFMRGVDMHKLHILKLTFWLGRIQATMVERGYTSYDAENEFVKTIKW